MDHFDLQGPQATHLCFILHILSTSIEALRCQSPTLSLPAHAVKQIVTLTLQGLQYLHELGIIHTGPHLTLPLSYPLCDKY